MCREPGVLAFDCPPSCDSAIMNAAYAGKNIVQSEQFTILLDSVKTCAMAGGKVLLPVPPKGRGIEIAQFLGTELSECNIPIFVENAVYTSYKQLATEESWIKEGILSEFPSSLTVLNTDEDSLEEGTATYSSILAWRIPRKEEPGRLLSIWLHRVRCN